MRSYLRRDSSSPTITAVTEDGGHSASCKVSVIVPATGVGLNKNNIDIFENDGVYYFSEVNPRFGGGYPHAYVCGADHMTLIKNNLSGKINERKIGNYQIDKVMMKYNEIMLKDAVSD